MVTILLEKSKPSKLIVKITGEFGRRKSSLPYGQVPLLEYDGVTICQSITITRFLANECGLAGKDHLENAKIDEVVDAVSDLLTARVTFPK